MLLQKDHDAAFIWNGINYLLKMPSDLDYLSEYLAINRWMGFSLERNPFCVPYAMEEGAAVYNGNNRVNLRLVQQTDVVQNLYKLSYYEVVSIILFGL